MKRKLPNLKTSPLDDLFSTEEQRIDSNLEKVCKIKISDIKDFEKHPFSVRIDDDMIKLIDSVRENGILVPAIVRPCKDGNGYEMIAGHRRKFALEQVGIDTIDAIVRDVDDDQATVIMVDSNVQREKILPTERGFAYSMKLEAMKHQGKKTIEIEGVDIPTEYSKKTCAQVEHKSKNKKSIELLGDELGVDKNYIRRHIRLTFLIDELKEMVNELRNDGLKLGFLIAVELSYLKEDEQQEIFKIMERLQCTPSLTQAQIFKAKSKAKELTVGYMSGVLETEKANQKSKITLKSEDIDKYFPKSYSPKEKVDLIIELLKHWSKRKNREQSR